MLQTMLQKEIIEIGIGVLLLHAWLLNISTGLYRFFSLHRSSTVSTEQTTTKQERKYIKS